MRRYFHLGFLICLLASALSLGGCLSAGNPPAPVGEIPSLVQFPESLDIDVSQAGGSPAGAALGTRALAKAQAITDFSDIISLGPLLFDITNSQLDLFLGPLADLEIPVGPSIRSFEGPMTFDPEVVGLVKIDFSDFDLDGDGATEGCTGCTCPTGCAPEISECPSQAATDSLRPICYRIWLRDVGQTEFARFAAGRINRYATRDDPVTDVDEANAGNGSFRLGVLVEGKGGPSESLEFGANYRHRDDEEPLRRLTELFAIDELFSSPEGETPSEQVAMRQKFHSFVTQKRPKAGLPPEALEKLVKLDMREEPDPPEDPGIVQYIGSFLDGFDFWSGTFNLQDTDGSKRISGENVCALVSTGLETARENCLDLGIDVDGQQFLRPTEEADVVFPADFPLAPTF